MEGKQQLAIAWKVEATASDLVAFCSDPKHLPPFIQQHKSTPGLYVLYKVSRPGQTDEIVFYKSFQDGTFEQQVKAAKICLYEAIQNGVIKPSKAARKKAWFTRYVTVAIAEQPCKAIDCRLYLQSKSTRLCAKQFLQATIKIKQL